MGAQGKKLRCSHCVHTWFQKPVENAERPAGKDKLLPTHSGPGEPKVRGSESEPAKGDPEPHGESENAPHDIETEAARLLEASRRVNAVHKARERQQAGAARGWAALAAVVILTVAGAVSFRDTIVRQFPGAARLYAHLNMPVNLRGMDFRNIRHSKGIENGMPVLTVRGEVVNLGDEPIEAPRLRFGLRDSASHEIYHWTVKVGRKPVAARGTATFVTKLASPPSEAAEVMIRFSGAGDMDGGS